MAYSDYKQNGGGAFASAIKLDAALDYTTTVINFTEFNFARPLAAGMAAMVDDEIMLLVDIGDTSITVKRGCADTLPAPHDAGRTIWIFDTSSVGTDRKEWNAGETIGVKFSPYTVSGAVVVDSVAPLAVEFNWRFARPYPPAKFTANGARWFNNATIDDTTPMLKLSWAHRDRVLQAERLLGQDDDSVGPEDGVTYTFRVYDPIADTMVREEVGIVGNSFTYQRAQATHDQGNPTEAIDGYYTLTAVRNGIESWQHYSGTFSLTPSYPLPSNYLAFEQRASESPYLINALRGVTAEGNFAYGVAARPSDRMSDKFDLMAGGALAQSKVYTPWLTLDVKLVELETIVNVRATSSVDGVPLPADLTGKLLTMDDEIVQVIRVISERQIEVKRGCADTVPSQHIAGSRAWLADAGALDVTNRASGAAVDYKFRPGVYGDPIAMADLPTVTVTFAGRSMLPYAPGRVVVNGRPWFEEVQDTSGLPVSFSWARRNRVTQGAQVIGHIDADVPPEAGAQTKLTFYYVLPGGETQVLREVTVAGTSYSYSYSNAQADGLTAGQALASPSTVLIYCRIAATRDGLDSYQHYDVPIRVPSYAPGP